MRYNNPYIYNKIYNSIILCSVRTLLMYKYIDKNEMILYTTKTNLLIPNVKTKRPRVRISIVTLSTLFPLNNNYLCNHDGVFYLGLTYEIDCHTLTPHLHSYIALFFYIILTVSNCISRWCHVFLGRAVSIIKYYTL